MTVQTACSTSMVAIHLARCSLLSNETDMALAGAVSVRVPHRAGYFCDGGGIVSPDGHVRAFDAGANGTVFGSGGGILVLKRLADAVADGDTVHAVIKGSAVNNDGSEKAGYTAPSVNSQADAVVEALANAGVEAESIGYVETHGSGTPVGDPIEIRALTKAFRTFTPRSGYCAVGSVKTNIGHLDAAAGIAGIIKTVLALKHRQLPPSLHFREANPEIDFAATPFYVNTELREWVSAVPRRAGVMSTGMGGTNAHVVLEEAPDPPAAGDARAPHLLIVSARTESALDRATAQLRDFLIGREDVNLRDVAYTLQAGRKAFPHRRCIPCLDRQDAIAALSGEQPSRLLSGLADESRRPVILLLPGVGDHYVGMGHGLYETSAVFRDAVDRCAQILTPHLGMDIRSILYPNSQGWKEKGRNSGIDLKQMLGRRPTAIDDPDSRALNTTLFVQPALFTIEYAMTRLWQALGVTPDAIVGHSMGEYVAACIAGVWSLEDALRILVTRARLVNELPRGAMLAVMLPERDLALLLPDDLSIALINGPDLCVVAGPVDAVAEFERQLTDRNILCRPVHNAHPFHSRMLDPVVDRFEADVSGIHLHEPSIRYMSNVTGTWITPREATSPAYWAAHANHTARFSDALHSMWQFKNPILLEAGPGRTLGVLAMQHPDRVNAGQPVPVSSIRHHYDHQSDDEYLMTGIGRLWLSGTDIKWDRLYTGNQPCRVALPTYPFERQRYWLEPARVPETMPHTAVTVQKNPNASQWFYVPSWTRHLPTSLTADELRLKAPSDQRWLVFADGCGIAVALIARLTSAGQQVCTVTRGHGFHQLDACTFVLDPDTPGHYDALVRVLQARDSLPTRIVHAWSVDRAAPGQPRVDRFAEAQAGGFYSLLFLARALAAHHAADRLDLFALSSDVQDVLGTETLRPEKSTIVGPCMAIRQEYPNIRTKSIDLELCSGASEVDSAAEFLLGEFLDGDTNMFVAYRNGQRWVQTYQPVALPAKAHGGSSLRPGGVYLITGGLGQIGTALSEYLGRSYQARLVLVGRSRAPHPDAIERLEALGARVMYASASVADEAAMRNAIDQAYRRFGALHGVIHAAGVVGDNGLQEVNDCTHDNCERHFEAKARGLMVLEDLLEGKTLDFCLLVSSLTSMLGGIGHAAYAASNVYMDSFVRRHNRSHRRSWLSVNFDLWRFPKRAAIAAGFGKTVQELGHSPDEAIGAMETVLRLKNAGQILISTGDLAARLKQWISLESLDTEERTVPVPLAQSTRRSSAQTHDEGPRDETERCIARIWEEALGIEVGINDSFTRVGGHSLLAIRIVAELRKVFQIDLPVKALFDAPTVAELSSHIKNRLIADIDALTDEEAERLVSSE